MRYLNEALSEFSAGLAWCCLDSHHRELRKKYQSRQEQPGTPHYPKKVWAHIHKVYKLKES